MQKSKFLGLFIFMAVSLFMLFPLAKPTLASDADLSLVSVVRENIYNPYLYHPTRVRAKDNYVFLSSSDDDAITIFDISEPYAPIKVTEMVQGQNNLDGLDKIPDFFIQDNYLYVVSAHQNALTIFDISDIQSPTMVSHVYDGDGNFDSLNLPNAVFVEGDYAYVGSIGDRALTIIDVSDPVNPSFVGKYANPILDNPGNFFVKDRFIYLPIWNSSRVLIIDATDPSNPVVARTLVNGAGYKLAQPIQTFVQGDLLFITSRGGESLDYNSFTIVNVTDPYSPQKVSEIYGASYDYPRPEFTNMLQGPYSLWVTGDYAFVGSSDSWAITVIDITDPTNPVKEAEALYGTTYKYIKTPNFLTVTGDKLFVSAWDSNALTIIKFDKLSEQLTLSIAEDSIVTQEGQSVQNTITVSDDEATVTASYGEVIKMAANTWIWSAETSDGPTESQSVSITATISTGTQETASFDLFVLNVAPTLGEISSTELLIGETYTNSVNFTDPGADNWTASIDYGDGTNQVITLYTDKTFEISHTYSAPGTYFGTVTVIDKDGDSDTKMFSAYVLTPAEAIENLIETVIEMNLPNSTETSIVVKLTAAVKVLSDQNENNDHAATNILDALINYINAQTGKKISAEDAATLIEEIIRVSEAI